MIGLFVHRSRSILRFKEIFTKKQLLPVSIFKHRNKRLLVKQKARFILKAKSNIKMLLNIYDNYSRHFHCDAENILLDVSALYRLQSPHFTFKARHFIIYGLELNFLSSFVVLQLENFYCLMNKFFVHNFEVRISQIQPRITFRSKNPADKV